MRNNGILRIVARFLIPLIMLFALYVQFHGEYSPGGGFQAGVIFAAAWILFVLIYGLDAGLDVVPERAMFVLSACGALLYAFIGCWAWFWADTSSTSRSCWTIRRKPSRPASSWSNSASASPWRPS